MTNNSIKAAFERMWQHIIALLGERLDGIEEGAEQNVITGVTPNSPGEIDITYRAAVGGPDGPTGEITETTMTVPLVRSDGKLMPQILPVVTTTSNGLMSATDKVKLDDLSGEIEGIGGIEITDTEPKNASTVVTLDPTSEEIHIYTAEEVDAKIEAQSEEIADLKASGIIVIQNGNTLTIEGSEE